MHRHGFFQRLFGSCRQRKGEWLVKRASKKLALDVQQQDELRQFVQQFQHNRDDMEAARRESRREIMERLLDPQSDRATAKAALQERFANMREQADSMVDKLGDFIDGLNSQQRQQLHHYLKKYESQHSCCH